MSNKKAHHKQKAQLSVTKIADRTSCQ